MRLLRRIGIVIAVIVLILALAAATIYGLSERRFSRQYAVSIAPLVADSGGATIERGKHVATIRGCVDCHQPDLGGSVMIESGPAGLISATNLTRGSGGVGAKITEENFVSAVRHGVGRDGRSLRVMPSQEFWYLTDTDVAALLAYVRSLPPVDRELPPTRIALLLRGLFVTNSDVMLLPAERIDHSAPRPQPPTLDDPKSLGQYLAASCTGCHGEGLSGGKIPGMPPEWPPAPNLTTGGPMKTWTLEQFATAMRNGQTPDGPRARQALHALAGAQRPERR